MPSKKSKPSGKLVATSKSGKTGRANKTRLESEEQQLLINWRDETREMQADPALKEALYWLFAVPMGFLWHVRMRIRAKAEGAVKGVSDLILLAPSRCKRRGAEYNFLAIEMKRKGEHPTPEQVRFLEWVQSVGGKSLLAYTWQAAARAVVNHLGLENYAAIAEEA